MNSIVLNANTLSNLKKTYQKPMVYELFKKYQTLLLLKKIVNNKPVRYSKKIDITGIYPTILSKINSNYDASLEKYRLKFPTIITTLSELLGISDNKLNTINILLLNLKMYNLEFIDFILPIATSEKILINLIVFLYNSYPTELGCYRLYQKYINPRIEKPAYTTTKLNDYSESVVKQMNLIYIIKDYLNVKVEDYHKNKRITYEQTENTTLTTKTTDYTLLNNDVQKIAIEYINCVLYFETYIDSEDVRVFMEDYYPNNSFEIVNNSFEDSISTLNIVFDCIDLHTLDAIHLHKSITELVDPQTVQKNIFKTIDHSCENTVDLIYVHKEVVSEVESQNIKQQINIFGSIEEEMDVNQLLIYKIIMRFYKTTNISRHQKVKIGGIIEQLKKWDLKF